MGKGKNGSGGSGDNSLQAETLSMMRELGLSTEKATKQESAKQLRPSNGQTQPKGSSTKGSPKLQATSTEKKRLEKPRQQSQQQNLQKKVKQQPQQHKPFVVPKLDGSKARKESTQTPSTSESKHAENVEVKRFDAKAFAAKAYNGKSAVQKVAKGSTQVSNKWWASGKDTQRSLVPPDENSMWYTLQKVDVEASGSDIPEANLLVTISNAVRAAFEEEVNSFQKAKATKLEGEQKWINDVLKSGTASDKVAALALVVQESPVHELAALDSLIAIAGKTEQRTSHLALEALKDLLIHNLLPDRHLRPFSSQPLLHSSMDRTAGILFWYEGELLQRVFKVVDAIENGMKSNIEFFKKQCMELAAELLAGKPEQESRLLALLVNKLGDPSNAVCSKAIELLKNTLRTHPAMKGVVVREVRQLIYRPGLHLRTVHNGVVFLSQAMLVNGDHEVAAQLVDCYMSLFEKAVKQNELKSRLLSVLLHGIDKAFPFLKNKEPVTKHADALFRLIHSESFSTTTRALMLLSHVALADADAQAADSKKGKNKNKDKKATAAVDDKANGADGNSGVASVVNRYYRALYSALLSPQVTTRSQNTLFFNLLYRSMKKDPSDNRLMAFMKRLAICALQSSAPIAAGIIYLMSEVVRARPSITEMLSALEKPIDPSKNQNKNSKKDDNVAKEENVDGDDDQEGAASMHQLGNYEASKLEPIYAVASTPSLWEASLLLHHFHPSVKSFMHSFVEEPHQITFGGDPTVEFSLAAFLNRFAYKNPKKQHSDKIRRPVAREEDPVNSATFLTKSYADTAPDKRYFLKFFGEKEKLRAEGKSRDRNKRKQKRGEEDEEGDGGFGDDDEEEIDAFADKLAEDLMRDTENGAGPADIDDFSDDDLGSFGDDDDGSADDDEGGDFADADSSDGDEDFSKPNKKVAKAENSKNKKDNRKMGALVVGDGTDDGRLDVTNGDAGMDGMDVDDDSDGDDGEDFDMGSDDDDDDDDALDYAFEAGSKGQGKGKRGIDHVLGDRKNKRARNDMSDFAAAEDYEDTMEEIIQMHALKGGVSAGSAGTDDATATAESKKGSSKSSAGGGKGEGKGKANVKDTKAGGDSKSAATRNPLKKDQKKK